MLAGWKTLDIENNYIILSYLKTNTWTTVKENTGRIQSWGRNRSFICQT